MIGPCLPISLPFFLSQLTGQATLTLLIANMTSHSCPTAGTRCLSRMGIASLPALASRSQVSVPIPSQVPQPLISLLFLLLSLSSTSPSSHRIFWAKQMENHLPHSRIMSDSIWDSRGQGQSDLSSRAGILGPARVVLLP